MKGKTRQASKRGSAASPRAALDPELIFLMSFVEAGRFADVESLARRILARRRDHPLALKALSFAVLGLGRFDEALSLLDYAIALNPQDVELHNNQGIALSFLMRWEDSLASFDKARRLTPDDPVLPKNMGVALARMHRWNDAVPFLLEAIEKHPGDYVEAINLLADCLSNAHRVDEALTCFRALYDAANDDPYALYQLLSISLRGCDWEHHAQRLALLRTCSRDFSARLHTPFRALAFCGLGGSDLRRIAETHALEILPAALPSWMQRMPPLSARTNSGHLKIGYISGDLRRHAVGRIVAEVIERHDRSRVEVFAYSTTADDGSDVRQRLMAAFDHFIDLTDASIEQTIQRIRSDGIDVLIDLSGWTSYARPEALALRCAPVQANWLGYAGTMGDHRLADYIIGDAVVTPLRHASFYTEQIVQLPSCYLPADTTRAIGEAPSRATAGLPESAFIFCSFNNSYKFNPAVFDLWCRVLSQAPDSVLWLTHPGDSAAENLRREFAARGLGDERLIFAQRVAAEADYLARLQVADLALDPFPYNSHSTGVDMLWAGVPMVTLMGETFAGRVGASLLTAVGMTELIAENQDEYARLALDLYWDRERLAGLHETLRKARTTAALFDITAFARALEDLYFDMAGKTTAADETPVAAASAAAFPLEPGPVS